MSSEFRPHDLWLWLTSHAHSTAAANACILGSSCFFLLAIGSGDRLLRNLAFTGATVTAFAGQQASRIRNQTDIVYMDVSNRSRSGRIEWLDFVFNPKNDAYDVAEIIQPLTIEDCLDCPHIMIVGETGAGKSTLATAIAQNLSSDVVVIDPHAEPKDWQGFSVVGMGRDYPAIAAIFSTQLQEMDRRYSARAKGEFSGSKLTVIVDELPAIASSQECSDIFPLWFQTLGCEARKVGIQLILLTQADNARVLDLDGKGQLRQNFTPLRLGSFAETHAKRTKDKAIQLCVAQMKRPAMLGDKPFEIPETSDSRTLTLPSPTQPSAIAYSLPGPEAPPIQPSIHLETHSKLEAQSPLNPDLEPITSSSEVVLDGEDLVTLGEINRLQDLGLSMTAIIRSIWNCKGGHRFQQAREEYRRLTGK